MFPDPTPWTEPSNAMLHDPVNDESQYTTSAGVNGMPETDPADDDDRYNM